jgi:hypothetical protein
LLVHVAEEAPGFVDWFNGLVADGITFPLFAWVNAGGFLITLSVAMLLASSRDKPAALVAIAWLGFLMLGNSIVHITATLVLGRYAPGVVTSLLLYLPFFLWFLVISLDRFRLRLGTALLAAAAGALPMLVHGYFTIFEGQRLV